MYISSNKKKDPVSHEISMPSKLKFVSFFII